MTTPMCLVRVCAVFMLSVASYADAQEGRRGAASVVGRVTEASTGDPVPGAAVVIEGSRFGATTDSSGTFRIVNAPAGPQVVRAQRIGFAPARVNVVVPGDGLLAVNFELARNALALKGVRVTADPASRARGELGTASVIEIEAIRNQMAASLAGVLELVPGVPLQAPGLDNVQQVSLRSVPISFGASSGDRSAATLAAFGTLIVLDGVPLSNNANLQTLGSRAELSFSGSAGGGIDLRRIPAATLERVEVIRGVPSARYGDLTSGAIIVDTRAGAIDPSLSVRLDAATTEASLVGGSRLGVRHTGSFTTNLARTRPGSGARNDEATRFAAQLAHRASFGGDAEGVPLDEAARDARVVFDTRAEFYRLVDVRPEIATSPGVEFTSREAGGRLLERMRLRLGESARLEWTAAWQQSTQRSFSRANHVRGATPVTNRTEPGRQVGRYLGGIYNARATVEGDPGFLYSRAELALPRSFAALLHDFRLGSELRREANSGSGFQFDIEFPPQSAFNGVRGFDRPRAFSSIPALATSALYLDDRVSATLPGGMLLNLQAGVRADLLHRGETWFSGTRDVAWQPRLNLEIAPTSWFRLRAGAGRLAKSPSLGELSPATDYYDVINVNYFANVPEERLAVLTTFLFDPGNPDLGYAVADRAEGGFEVGFGGGTNVSFTAFADRTSNGVGIRPEATFITRERFDLINAVPGSGQPPTFVEPAASVDSIPVLIERPANNVALRSSGFEVTADFEEIPVLRTRIALQGAFVKSSLLKDGIEFAPSFRDFQVNERELRAPYYESVRRTGERFLLNTRIIHQLPEVGLVVTGTIQHTLREIRRNVGGTDTLAFVGYITRTGVLVPIPAEERARPEYADIRVPRTGVLATPQKGAVDWMFSLQVSKSLPGNGRLSFYAFNAFDRVGRFGSGTVTPRVFQPNRFGLEVMMPLQGFVP